VRLREYELFLALVEHVFLSLEEIFREELRGVVDVKAPGAAWSSQS
jgi:hypothetical protein